MASDDASAKTRLTLRASRTALQKTTNLAWETKPCIQKKQCLGHAPERGRRTLCCFSVPLGRGSASGHVFGVPSFLHSHCRKSFQKKQFNAGMLDLLRLSPKSLSLFRPGRRMDGKEPSLDLEYGQLSQAAWKRAFQEAALARTKGWRPCGTSPFSVANHSSIRKGGTMNKTFLFRVATISLVILWGITTSGHQSPDDPPLSSLLLTAARGGENKDGAITPKATDLIDNTGDYKGKTIKMVLTYAGRNDLRDAVGSNAVFDLGNKYIWINCDPGGNGSNIKEIKDLPNLSAGDRAIITFICGKGDLKTGNRMIDIKRK